MSPRPVDKDEKKRIILNAALQVIKAKGYSEATVEEIASTAKIGKGTVYEYFKSKEEIVQKLVNDFFLGQEQRFKDFKFQPVAVETAIQTFLDESFFDIENSSDIIPIYFEFWSSGKGKALGFNKRMSSRFEKMTVVLNKFLREGKKEKLFIDTMDSKTLSSVIISSIDGLILYHALLKPRKVVFDRKVKELQYMITGYIKK
jgi:AcrR family transcriptional regulator